MDPSTLTALTFIAVKLGEKILDKSLDGTINTMVEKVVPKQTFHERLRVCIQNAAIKYNEENPAVNEGTFSFVDSEESFSQLVTEKIYDLTDNPLSLNKFFSNENISPVNQKELDNFFALLMEQVREDIVLRKLFVEEYYKEAIFDVKNSVNSVENKIDTLINYKKHEPNLFKSSKNSSSNHKFDYRNELTDFVGRNEEFNYLDVFFRHSQSAFSWCLITGDGGSGKSRLALEFCKRVENDGIRSGFIDINEIESFEWNSWQPEIPHLIVIDEVVNSLPVVLRLIKVLSLRNDFSNHVRIILIERDTQGEWWKNFTNDYDISRAQYLDSPFIVSGLDPIYLSQVVNQFTSRSGILLIIDEKDLQDTIIRLDYRRRPLFSMFIGIALANGNHINDWNQDNLLDFYIGYEYNKVKKRFGEYNDEIINKHKNLLTIATMCRGLTVDNLEYIFEQDKSWLPKRDELDNDLYSALSGNSKLERSAESDYMHELTKITHVDFKNNTETVSSPFNKPLELNPLLPDVIGEYFVLKNLQQNSKFRFKDKNKFFDTKNISKNLDFYNYNAFVGKALTDFPFNDSITELIKEESSEIVNYRGYNGRIILNLMRWFDENKVETHNLVKLLNYTKQLYDEEKRYPSEKGFYDNPKRVYFEAVLVMLYDSSDSLEKQIEYYTLIKENTVSFDRNKAPITPVMLANNSIFDEEDIREILTNGFTDAEQAQDYLNRNTSIFEGEAMTEACAINAIIKCHLDKKDNRSITNLLSRMNDIAYEFNDPRIKNCLLDTYTIYGIKLVDSFDEKIRRLYLTMKKTPLQVDPIDVEHEKFIFTKNIVMIYINDNVDLSVYYYADFFESLKTNRPNARTINAFYNMGLLAKTLSAHYFDRKNLVIGELYIKAIKSIMSLCDRRMKIFLDLKKILSEAIDTRNKIITK